MPKTQKEKNNNNYKNERQKESFPFRQHILRKINSVQNKRVSTFKLGLQRFEIIFTSYETIFTQGIPLRIMYFKDQNKRITRKSTW